MTPAVGEFMTKSQFMNTDEKLKHHFLCQLGLDPRVHTDGLGVSVRNGAVTLKGTVPSYADKAVVSNAVRNVAGVKKLADEVTVVLPEAQRRPDNRIADTALNAIKCITTVPTDRITVAVQGGRLMLGGTVESWGQKETVEEVVRTLTGITDVIDTIAIEPPPSQRAASGPTKAEKKTPLKPVPSVETSPASSGTMTFVWR
jgi:osmotically-inducible protein OsmY